jgi:hypothetical protein
LKSIGPLYVDTIKLKHPLTPVFEWGWSQETEEPYRESAVCLVFWVPFINRGYAIGIWGKPVSEETALQKIFREAESVELPRVKEKFLAANPDFDMDNVQIGDTTYKVVKR